MEKSYIILLILVGLFVFLSLGSIGVFMNQGYYDAINDTNFHFHGFYCLLGTFLIGCSLIVFRLLRDIPTVYPRHIHTGVASLGFVLIVFGIVWADVAHWEYFDDMHVYPGYAFVMGTVVQLIYSSFVMTKMYARRRRRSGIVYAHNIIGLGIYVFFVAFCLSGATYLHKSIIMAFVEPTTTTEIPPITTTTVEPTTTTARPQPPLPPPSIETLSPFYTYILGEHTRGEHTSEPFEVIIENRYKRLREYNYLLYAQSAVLFFTVLSPFFAWDLVPPL